MSLGGDEPSEPDPRGGDDAERAADLLEKVNTRVAGLREAIVGRPGGLQAWRIVVAIAGAACIAVGVVMLVTPGPAWVMILLGLGIWTTEFAWVRDLVGRAYSRVRDAADRLSRQPRWMVVVAATALVVLAVVVWLSVA